MPECQPLLYRYCTTTLHGHGAGYSRADGTVAPCLSPDLRTYLYMTIERRFEPEQYVPSGYTVHIMTRIISYYSSGRTCARRDEVPSRAARELQVERS